jgi:DNA-binding transcriptional LysR family regulator
VDLIITSQKIDANNFMNLEKINVPVVLCCSSKWTNQKYTDADDNDKAINELKNCSDVQWVLPATHFDLRSQIDKFFDENVIEKKVVFESDSFSALVRSVHNELGFSFLPLLHVSNEIKGNHLKRLGSQEGFWKYQIALGCHVQNKNDELVKAFFKSFGDACEQVSCPHSEIKGNSELAYS